MAATVHGSARHGCTDETSATGLALAQIVTTYICKINYVLNHIGCKIGASFFDDSSEVKCSGVVATKVTGLVPDLAAAITLANSSADSLNTNYKNLFTTNAGSAGLLVSGASLTRVNADFETGEVDAVFNPLFAANAPSTVT
jgi:hypothetical protein